MHKENEMKLTLQICPALLPRFFPCLIHLSLARSSEQHT